MDLVSRFNTEKLNPSVAAAHSCNICAMFVLDFGDDYSTAARCTTLELGGALLQGTQELELKRLLKGFVIFPLKISDLAGWALSGCSFCEFLHEKMGHPVLLERRDGKKYIAAEWRGGDSPIHIGPFECRQELDGGSLRDRPALGDEQAYIFRPVVSPKSPLASTIAHRPINYDPASPIALQMARKWLLKCTTNHGPCRRLRERFKPKRLIRISSINKKIELRLVENPTTTESYAALSYCWGGPQRVMTERRTLFRHLKRIDHESLPKTLRDAIKVCYSLGISYLWVDALCIVQDDQTDKNIEIARMSKIYGCAAITIIASRSSSVEQGFLHPRQPPHNSPDSNQIFKVKLQAPNKSIGAVNLIPLQPLCEDEEETEDEPLDHRAWAFQERHLSPCILDFGSWRTSFVCKHGVKKHNIPSDGWSSDLVYSNRRRDRARAGYDEWYEYIDTYTQRDLTVSTDRPLAISGIAENFQSKQTGTYIAGLWCATLPTGLLWTLKGPTRPKPKRYQGPSWSWLGVNGQIYPSSTTNSFATDPGFKILSAKTELAIPKAIFGALKFASLTVKARLIPVKYICDPQEPLFRRYFFTRMDTAGSRRSSRSDLFSRIRSDSHHGLRSSSRNSRHDSDSRPSTPQRPLVISCHEDTTDMSWIPTLSYSTLVFLLYIGEDENGMKGLVLRRSDEQKNTYSRVGAFESYRLIRPTDSYRKWDFEEEVGGEVGAQAERQKNWVLEHEYETVTLI